MSMKEKVRRWFRSKYLIHKYKSIKHNSDRLIYVRSRDDRQLGLTTTLIKDAVKYNIPILVPSLRAKRMMAQTISRESEKLDRDKYVSERYAFDNLVIIPSDILDHTMNTNLVVLVDNQCSEGIVRSFITNNLRRNFIVVGFVSAYFM